MVVHDDCFSSLQCDEIISVSRAVNHWVIRTSDASFIAIDLFLTIHESKEITLCC